MMKKVYYINLEERGDRRRQFERQMQCFGLRCPEQVVRFPAVKHDPGYVGCTWSHVGVLRQALETMSPDDEFVAVFEDDFCWKMSRVTFDDTLHKFLSGVDEWDVLLLTGIIWNLCTHDVSDLPEDIGVKKCTRSQTASGYLVHRGYISTLLALFEESARELEAGGDYNTWALDQRWHSLQERDRWFIMAPGAGKQRAGYSDIEKKHVDYPFI